ncbi:MAG: TonB-dependent receptor, partial [Bacteroidetes bacterium]|nr:TonB-dependent receptor [Bacteroidota bacterium]
DENLVYVNDIEIYRPFLVRSGEQEGLSFLNSDLVSGISFSAGGFEAKYGDKMSSVLDIQYRKPKEFAGSISGSLLGVSGHLEGVAKKMPLTFLIGVRQKSNQYLLKSLETKGDYKPSFTDIQGLFSYDFSEKFTVSFLGNYARNKYLMVPQTRETDFGTLNEALRLTIYFDGQEVDKFDTYMGAFSANYAPNIKTNLKFIASAFRSLESETYDIQGQYWLDQLENDMGNDQFGQVAFNMGVGTFLNHARNYLDALVYSAEHKGTKSVKKSFISWGAKYQHESISDKMSEWQMTDSAGYTLPYNPSGDLILQEVVKSVNSLESNRYSGYLQNVWTLDGDSSGFSIRTGIRANYWDVNKQLLLSPRATIAYRPNLTKDVLFRFSTGYYYQPPFYRELRDLNGNLNRDLKAQETIHFVLGSDWSFKAWGRPFKYIAEVYYKYMDNLVPYEIDNVRIRYYAKNNAKGYATGIDMKVNGEFVNGIESWASLSIMQTQEDIKDDFYYDYFNKSGEQIIPGYTFDNIATDSIRHEPGYIPRPTDQRVTFSLFFQDYLPKLPSFKMHLNLVFGSGLPFGPPGYDRYKDILRIPAYRRVDIGFSYMLKSEEKKLQQSNPFHYLKSIWLSLEVFNLLQTNNTVSYIWIKDVTNRQYAVPNYLTSRQLNLRLITHF